MHTNDLFAAGKVRAIANVVSLSAEGAGVHLLRGGLQLALLAGLGELCKLRRVALVPTRADVVRIRLPKKSQAPGAGALPVGSGHGIHTPVGGGRVESLSERIVIGEDSAANTLA